MSKYQLTLTNSQSQQTEVVCEGSFLDCWNELLIIMQAIKPTVKELEQFGWRIAA